MFHPVNMAEVFVEVLRANIKNRSLLLKWQGDRRRLWSVQAVLDWLGRHVTVEVRIGNWIIDTSTCIAPPTHGTPRPPYLRKVPRDFGEPRTATSGSVVPAPSASVRRLGTFQVPTKTPPLPCAHRSTVKEITNSYTVAWRHPLHQLLVFIIAGLFNDCRHASTTYQIKLEL